MEEVLDWLRLHEDLLVWLGTPTLLIMLIAVLALPVVVIKLPEDYFESEHRDIGGDSGRRTILGIVVALIKNVLGVFMILAGLLMLVLPGQGALSILIGVAMTNFPGKFRLERRLVRQPSVLAALNKIRKLAGATPLRVSIESTG